MLETRGDSLGRNLNSYIRSRKKQLRNADEIMSKEDETKQRHRNQKSIKKEKRRYPELNTSVHNNGN
jgi:Sec-independent protein translocase protein TatA